MSAVFEPGPPWSHTEYFIPCSRKPSGAGAALTPILQMRKRRFREVRWLA